MKTTLTLIVMILLCASTIEVGYSQPTIDTTVAESSDDRLSDSGAAVIAWNKHILEAAVAEDGLLTLKGVRTAAMAHIAIHDVANSISKQYATHTCKHQHKKRANPQVAAIEAAFVIASHEYPERLTSWQEEKNHWLNKVEDSTEKQNGLLLGRECANTVLEKRQTDSWNSEAEYKWHPMAPGVYAEFNEHSGTPQGFIFGAGWAKTKPFALTKADQFRAPPPPDIKSVEYTKAFNEVKEYGRFNSTSRSADQTHLALWWKDFAENSHNRLARKLASEQNLDLVTTSRLFALLNIAIFDAYINVFDNKFYFNHWRPYTAIRWADNDGNRDTVAEKNWTNTHKHTYAFPSYPSAHRTACAAAMKAFEETFGTEFAFTMSIPEVDIAGPFSGKMQMKPVTRSFTSFTEAAHECSMSRVYLGIHFRYDSEQGTILGTRIGEFVIANYLQKI